MQVDGSEQLLADARTACDRSDWSAAFEAFGRADSELPLEAEDLERAGLTAMWLGEFEACIEFRQRAFGLRVAEGDVRRAAGLAIELCVDQAVRHHEAVALGWAQRAATLLEGSEPCSALGRLEELQALIALEIAHDVATAMRHYDEALRIGRLCNDADLVAGALVGSGTALVRVGRVSEGLRQVDEAMIDAVSGLLGGVQTARIYCNTISLCQALGDIRRASEWTEQAMTCSSRPGMGDFPGDCRMHRAEITRLRGDWAGAESELRLAMGALERWSPGHVGQAWYELGEIALRRGDLAAAADAFERAAGCGKDPQPGLAMLRLAEGEEAVALALLRVAAENAGDADPLAVGQLLPAIVDAQLACGDVRGAQEAAERLAGIARLYGTVVLEARAATSRARVALAAGAADEAVASARTAVNLWRDAGAPYEAAQTQHLLAEAAMRTDDREVAIVELEAALAMFTSLGAMHDIEAAQRLRDRLGGTAIGHQVRRTFMFTDIVDSTRLVAEMGDVGWSTALHSHDRTIRDLLVEHGGSEVKQRGGGDGFFAVFTSPTDAIDCAVAIQRRFAEHRDTHGFAPEIRIGVHEADALLSGSDFAGLGVHEAARIAAHANGGSILASQATATTAGATTIAPPREVALKGLSDRLAVQDIPWSAATERK
jgi:class 3 adenylate cyclase